MIGEYNKKRVFAWSMYDFANQPFSTLIITFIYGTFFTKVIAENEIIGTTLWSRAMTITAITVAFLSPIMGAVADKGGYRKLFLMFWTYICIIGSFALYFPLPGEVFKALFWVVIANIGFEMGGVFCNAYLPDIAPKDKIGRVSGYGWSFGYVGGLAALTLSLILFVQPEIPAFGVSKVNGEHIRVTNILVSIWFLIFSIPVFAWIKSDDRKQISNKNLWEESFGQLMNTFRNIRKYKDLLKLLVARIFYNDGLVTIFAFGGIYAAGTFNFSFEEIMIFGIVLNITAGSGALLLGFLDDKIGGKKTIQLSNIGLIFACIIAVIIPNKDLFTLNIPLIGITIISGKSFFWLSGILIGLFSGPNQASSRSLMARFIPQKMENEFFGFFAFSGKATAFIGPLLLGIMTKVFNSQRYGVAIVVIMFIIGFILLSSVDEENGIKTANRN